MKSSEILSDIIEFLPFSSPNCRRLSTVNAVHASGTSHPRVKWVPGLRHREGPPHPGTCAYILVHPRTSSYCYYFWNKMSMQLFGPVSHLCQVAYLVNLGIMTPILVVATVLCWWCSTWHAASAWHGSLQLSVDT